MSLDKTFKQYLKAGVDRKAFGDTPENDFACDALRDGAFRDFAVWEELQNYILFHGGDVDVVTAAHTLFRRWKAAQ